MAPIRIKLLSSYNAVVALLLSILGFSSSCKKDEIMLMYGTPHAGFILKGKVESAQDGSTVRDIIVEIRKVSPEDEAYLVETGFSRSNGNFEVVVGDSPEDQTYNLRFVDTDGVLNGEFAALDTTVVFNDPVFTGGDGGWYQGYVEKEIDVKLKPQK